MSTDGHKSVEEYRQRILSLVNLPTLPIIATEIIRVTREDKLSINQILPILEKDPPLAMKVLKVANSSYYGLREKIKSLRHAIVVIGMEQLSSIALSFSVIKAVGTDQDQKKINWKKYWEHSSATGVIAQMIVEDLGMTIPFNPYSVGLLHDIGKLILFQIDPQKYAEVYELCQKTRCTSVHSEMEIFGITHEQVGSWISEKWNLPENMQTGISFHHDPESMAEQDKMILPALIQVADWIANQYSFRFANYIEDFNPLEVEGWKILKNHFEWLSDNNLKQFLNNVEEQLDSIGEMVQVLFY